VRNREEDREEILEKERIYTPHTLNK